MTTDQPKGAGEIASLMTDAGRDRVEVQVRLDKVVLAIQSRDGGRGQAKLTPADARQVSEALAHAAGTAEETPH